MRIRTMLFLIFIGHFLYAVSGSAHDLFNIIPPQKNYIVKSTGDTVWGGAAKRSNKPEEIRSKNFTIKMDNVKYSDVIAYGDYKGHYRKVRDYFFDKTTEASAFGRLVMQGKIDLYLSHEINTVYSGKGQWNTSTNESFYFAKAGSDDYQNLAHETLMPYVKDNPACVKMMDDAKRITKLLFVIDTYNKS